MFFLSKIIFNYLFVCDFCVIVCKEKKWEWFRGNCCILFVCFFSSSFPLFCYFWDTLLPNFRPGCRRRDRGALAVWVKALHCLMLNTSFCTSCFRGLCDGWGGGGWGVGSHCTVMAHTTHKHTLGAQVEVCAMNPWMKWVHNDWVTFFSPQWKPMIWQHGHRCENFFFLL